MWKLIFHGISHVNMSMCKLGCVGCCSYAAELASRRVVTIPSNPRGILIAGFASASNRSSLACSVRGRRGEAGGAHRAVHHGCPGVRVGAYGCLWVPMGTRWYLWAPCMVTLAAPWVPDGGGFERTKMGAAWVSAYTVAVASAAGEPLEEKIYRPR